MRTRIWDLLYLLGRTPWDTRITPPELIDAIGKKQITFGKAVDLGCGTGTNAIYLAQHGFETFGVDVSLLAILIARFRVRNLRIPAKFTVGDILKLGNDKQSRFMSPVDFVLDIGCLNSLATDHLKDYLDMLGRILHVGGYYMLYAWGQREWRGRSVGLKPEELIAALESTFHKIWIKEGEEGGAPSYWYLLKRIHF